MKENTFVIKPQLNYINKIEIKQQISVDCCCFDRYNKPYLIRWLSKIIVKQIYKQIVIQLVLKFKILEAILRNAGSKIQLKEK